MDILRFIYPFISWCTFGLFLLFCCMNNAAVNVRVQDFVWTYVFILGGLFLGVELLSHRVTMFNLLGTTRLYYKVVVSFYFPTSKCESSTFATTLAIIFVFFFFLMIIILVGMKCYVIVVLICIILVNILMMMTISSYAFGHFYIFFGERSIQIFAHF